MGNIDEIIKAALQTEEEVSKELNRDLVQNMTSKAEKTLGRGTHRREGFARIAVAVACGIVILCSTSMAYAAIKGVDIGGLFAKVWNFNSISEGEGLQENAAGKLESVSLAALEGICSEVSVIKEKSTYKEDVKIEPVVAVSDKYSLYLVLKIEGDKKLISEKKQAAPSTFFSFKEKQGGDIVSTYSQYLLSVEENTIYYAMHFLFENNMKKKTGEFSLSVGNLYYIDKDDVDENGLILKWSQDENGTDEIAAEGQYDLTFSCPISEKEVVMKVEDNVEVKITPLCAYFNDHVFHGRVNQEDWTVIPEAFLLMEDGSRVLVDPRDSGPELYPYTLCELERPVDTDKIKGLEFHGKVYTSRLYEK